MIEFFLKNYIEKAKSMKFTTNIHNINRNRYDVLHKTDISPFHGCFFFWINFEAFRYVFLSLLSKRTVIATF